jgi:hypothetical protein
MFNFVSYSIILVGHAFSNFGFVPIRAHDQLTPKSVKRTLALALAIGRHHFNTMMRTITGQCQCRHPCQQNHCCFERDADWLPWRWLKFMKDWRLECVWESNPNCTIIRYALSWCADRYIVANPYVVRTNWYVFLIERLCLNKWHLRLFVDFCCLLCLAKPP